MTSLNRLLNLQFCRCSFKKYSRYTSWIKFVSQRRTHTKTSLDNGENISRDLLVPLQKSTPKKTRKVSVIGAVGRVGVQVCYNLFIGSFCDEIVMVDRKDRSDKLTAEWKDFSYSMSEQPRPKFKKCMDMQNTKDSDLIIISAGISMKQGQSRLDVVAPNVKLLKEIIPPLVKLSPDSVMLIASNPTDVLTYAAWKISGFPKNRVLGAGTELDSSRFRYHIAKRLDVHPSCVTGWVIGEHGDSSVAVWSGVNVAGTKLRDIDCKIGKKDDGNKWDEIHKQVIKDGPMLIGMKGWTDSAISFVVEDIARAILLNERTVHAVSVQLKGLYGIKTDCYLSFPAVVGMSGVSQILKLCLSNDEIQKLQKSASQLDSVAKSLKL